MAPLRAFMVAAAVAGIVASFGGVGA